MGNLVMKQLIYNDIIFHEFEGIYLSQNNEMAIVKDAATGEWMLLEKQPDNTPRLIGRVTIDEYSEEDV